MFINHCLGLEENLSCPLAASASAFIFLDSLVRALFGSFNSSMRRAFSEISDDMVDQWMNKAEYAD